MRRYTNRSIRTWLQIAAVVAIAVGITIAKVWIVLHFLIKYW